MEQLHALLFGNNDLKEKLQPYLPIIAATESESVFLDILTKQPIDAIIFGHQDAMLSLNLLQRVRMVKKHMLTVLITQSADPEIMLQAIRLGLTDFLTLPLHADDIKGMERRLISAFMGQTRILRQNLLLNQYKNALDASLIISKTNLSGEITYVNEKMIEISGYSASEIIGRTHRLFKHPDTPKEQMHDLWQTILSKRVWHGTIINQTKEGEPFYADTFILPILNERHEISEYMDMRIDVTTIHKQKRYMQQILDAQNTIIVVFGGGETLQCNKRLLEYFNLQTLEEFLRIHKCICDIVVHAPECVNAEFFKKWVHNPQNKLDVKIALTRYDHQVRIFQVTKNTLNANNSQDQIIISLTDITEMDTYRHELQSKFNYAEEEIRNQQERLVSQSRSAALGEMFDNIAHQWRQPIGAINNAIINAEFAMELGGMSSDEILDTFKQINSYTAFLSGTIDDFRNFSNPDKEKVLFSPHNIIRQTLGILQGSFHDNNIFVTYIPTPQEQELMLFGSQGELSQVILNLLGNARDVLRDKGALEGYVHIALHTNGKEIIIKISDNGGGIPPEILPKIFDPYFSTKSKTHGTGIGLYMSKTIIEKHYKGKLEALNGKEGAIFTITLPIESDR